MSKTDLRSFCRAYPLPDETSIEVPSPCATLVDEDGLAPLVALFPQMFDIRLRLPICCPVSEVLDFLQLAPTQLHPNAWRLVLASCVAFRIALTSRDDCPDLTAREFFLVYRINRLNGNLCSFQSPSSERCFAYLDKKYSSPKEWFRRFFFIRGSGWERPKEEEEYKEFPVRSVWGKVPNSRSFSIDLSKRERSRVSTVIS